MEKNQEWGWEIKSSQKWLRLNIKELIHYKDLLFRFVRRDIIAGYQQTILGPLWVFLQPMLTTLVYFIIFFRIAKIPTDGISPVLFYLPGSIIWTYFSECLTTSMYTFVNNAYIFNKVYFPRLIVPLSYTVFQTFRMSIQLLLFACVYTFFVVKYHNIHPSWNILYLPLLIAMTAAFALGTGLIISVFTAKYRDLDNVLQFLLRLFMFAAPVVYPASIIPEKYRLFFWLNPLTAIIETFRAGFFSNTAIPLKYLCISVLSCTAVLFSGIILFNKKELEVMDVI